MTAEPEDKLTYSDVTPKGLYMGRRNFLLGLLVVTGSGVRLEEVQVSSVRTG